MAFEGRACDFPEALVDREELLRSARNRDDWYHSVRLTDDYKTAGLFDLDGYIPYYLMPPRLEGVSCLEIGAGNGYWSFLMEERGAASVVATDLESYHDTDFSILAGAAPACGPAGKEDFGGHFRIAAVLRESSVFYKLCSVYDIDRKSIGMSDFVFCGSMLMHLQGPQLALMRMAGVCGNMFACTTQTRMELDGKPQLEFRGHEIPYVHFLPSPSCLVNMVEASGYEKVLRGPSFNLAYRDGQARPEQFCHTSVIGLKRADNPCVPIASPRPYSKGERVARFEIVEAPTVVRKGEVFDVILNVINASPVDWRTDGEAGNRFSLSYEKATNGVRGLLDRSDPNSTSGILPDYLPQGTSSLVRTRIKAPRVRGRAMMRPVLRQGADIFDSNAATIAVQVD